MTEPTRQDPPELPSVATLLGWVSKRTVDVLLVVFLAAILGEIYLRTYLGSQHEYGPDAELGRRFKPNQEPYLGRINSDGHRGPETDWDRPLMVALGDSQAFGYGVPDDAVWTTRLAQLFNATETDERIQVVNAAHPAFGPYHQLIELRRVLARHPQNLRAIVVRVDIEDRMFLPPNPDTLASTQARTERRGQWRAWARLAPFLSSRLTQQYPSLISLVSWTSRKYQRPIAASVGEKMWTDQGSYWREMIDLAAQAQTPLIFFVHDPTNLPSNGVLSERLVEAGRDRGDVRVLRLDSEAWGLHGGTSDQLWEENHARYTLQHDHHGNEWQHAHLANVLFRYLNHRPNQQFAQRGVSNHP